MRQLIFLQLFFVLFSCGTNCFSQTDSVIVSPESQIDSSFHFPLILKTPPLTLIDFVNGASGVIVAESFPTKKISVSMELGAYYRLAGYGMKHLHGWRSGRSEEHTCELQSH